METLDEDVREERPRPRGQQVQRPWGPGGGCLGEEGQQGGRDWRGVGGRGPRGLLSGRGLLLPVRAEHCRALSRGLGPDLIGGGPRRLLPRP